MSKGGYLYAIMRMLYNVKLIRWKQFESSSGLRRCDDDNSEWGCEDVLGGTER